MRCCVRHGALVLGVLLGILCSQTANADPEECQDAIDAYNAAASDIETALQSYTLCISGSGGKDDCSLEFSMLQSAQDDFETAVSSYEGDCS